MANDAVFVDIHCHLVPGIDDGATSWQESLEMARLAAEDGIRHVIATPHQLGSFPHNSGAEIRRRTAQLQQLLDQNHIRLQVWPGADVRIEPEMFDGLRNGTVLTLADQHQYVLLELPHEMYFPLEDILDKLRSAGLIGILSHPERNQGLLECRTVIPSLVESGCLMQVTAGSLTGTFGPACRELAEWMLGRGLVHFLATDAHGAQARRPLMRRAYERAEQLVGTEVAQQICCHNPLAVVQGRTVSPPRPKPAPRRLFQWLLGSEAA